MSARTIDIWFGPGAAKGVFGAGVAHALQESIHRRELDASQIRLYGSSVGCLTAVFLATGNAACGLEIFQQETDKVVSTSNLVPALGARLVNRLASAAGGRASLVAVPSVLNLEHVFAVMARRTPNIVDQLRCSPTPIFAESVDRQGNFLHTELRSSKKPLQEIRHSLNYVPFAGASDSDLMDSVINGYGFIELVRSSQRPLVVVLNVRPTTRSRFTIGDLACAVLSADASIAQLYLRRRGNRRSACESAFQARPRVLIVSPPQIVNLARPSDFDAAHRLGQQAADRILNFVNGINPEVTSQQRSTNPPCCE